MKSNCIIKNIKLTLLALIGTLLLGAEAIGEETATQDGTAQEVAAPNTIAQGRNDKEVITASPAPSPAKKAKTLPFFAKVGDITITWTDYNNEYASQARNKFYHGKPSDDEVAAFQRKVGDTLVTNAMLLQEAKRRKLKPDAEFVKLQLEKAERRFAKDPNWPQARPRVLPILTQRAQAESLRNQVEPLVRNVRPPSVKQLRKYYAAHPDKFTSPAHERVSTILLRMDPGSPPADWQKALEQGSDLVKRLRAGEDFAKLAREYSGDVTAEDGGDMGYLHEGMLPGLPAQIVSKLQPGETSDPVTLMEGVAIFRLTERTKIETGSFEKVQQRARQLWLTEQSDAAWNSLMAKLKKNTPIQVDESRFLPLPVTRKEPVENTGTSKP